MAEKKIFFIDGNSLLYRSFYAIRRLSNSKGFPTNAIFGFLTSLNKFIVSESPQYLGIVFDSKGPTIRHDAFKEYKANRKPMPEDLIPQVPVLKEILNALNIPVFEMAAYEGDDLLGSLARRATELQIPSVIVTNDKDLYQLVDQGTSVYNLNKEALMDETAVKESFGVAPNQVVDVLALWGDPSDNIPGVPGIGEKTAKSLMTQFGSLESLLENLGQIKNPRIRQKLEDNLEKLHISRQLATIKKDLELPFDLDTFRLSEPDIDKLAPLLRDLGFSSLLAGYLKAAPAPETRYRAIQTPRELDALIEQIKSKRRLSIDTKTTSPFPTQARLVGISFATDPGEAYYLPLGHDADIVSRQIAKHAAFQRLRPVLADPKIKKIGQNIKYDRIVLQREGLPLAGIELDSMILSYLLEPNWGKHGLDRLALSHLQIKTISYHDIVGKGKEERTMNAVPVDRVTPYACQDADLALRLSDRLWASVKSQGLDKIYRDFEQPLIEVLADMETCGVQVDAGLLSRLSQDLGEELQALEKRIFSISGESFNINSPQQLAHILFDKMGLLPSRKTKITKNRSTNVDVLKDLARQSPIADHVLEYRQLSKLKSTYADALPLMINPQTGRIHTSYNQTVASTGRLSSSDPNLQNIPVRGERGRRFRASFIPSPGHLFLGADYSQIELRILAHLSQDPAMIETFRRGGDVHAETAERVFSQSASLFEEERRRRAKIINFSIIYGTSAFSLAKELSTSNAEARKFIDLYFEKYPGVRKFLDDCVETARDRGYSETLFGRKRPVPELRQANRVTQQAGRRIALNTPIQGTAADLMKKAMIDIWKELRRLKLKSRMIIQVHDELIFEVPKEECDTMEALVKEKMEAVHPLSIPLSIHLGWGINWAETK